MDRPFIKIHFYETYYFATCIRNILHDQFAYIRSLNEFYGDGAHVSFAAPFNKWSAFHSFLHHVIGDLLTHDTEECDISNLQRQIRDFQSFPTAISTMALDVLPIEHALRYHNMPFTSFVQWLASNDKQFGDASKADVSAYLEHLSDTCVIDTLLEHSVREAFFLLFGNRHVLMLFNDMMARQMSETLIDNLEPEFSQYFQANGILRRVRIPKWVQRCVFYRDRGICTFCGRDLSGVLSVWSEDHFDHIVPLAQGGLNDVTNIQLLCGDCNRTKRDGDAQASVSYEDWYSIDST